MSYDYSSESKLLELPNPYQLQNRLLWLCGALLLVAGVLSLFWAQAALQGRSLGSAAAPLLTGLALLAAGIACAAKAAGRLRFFFGRGRPASLAPEAQPGVKGGKDAEAVKNMLRQGGLTYPEPKGAVEGLLYHWAPALITAPQLVQLLAQRTMFNLAAIAATLLSFGVSFLLFGNATTRPWIAILYFLFGAFFILRPVFLKSRARLTSLSLTGLIAAAILGPVAIGLLAPGLPSLGGLTPTVQTTLMLVTGLIATGLAMAAVLAQVDGAPQTRASVEQARLSMNAPPSSLMDELDRTLQSQWIERIPNRRYMRIDPVTDAATPSGSFAGEMLEESQPLPAAGTKAPSFGAALADNRHRGLLLLDLYATLLTLAAIAFALFFVRNVDADQATQWSRYALIGNSAILAAVAAFCFSSAAQLWGRFNFDSVLIWVEMVGSYQTSRIGTGNNFSSRINTENNIVRTEAMTLRVWRARIESVVFGKDDTRQVTAMFSTEKEARALSAHLAEFACGQSVFVAPTASQDQARIAALNQGEQALLQPHDALPATQLREPVRTSAALQVGDMPKATTGRRHCTACGTEAALHARFCSHCAQPLTA